MYKLFVVMILWYVVFYMNDSNWVVRRNNYNEDISDGCEVCYSG